MEQLGYYDDKGDVVVDEELITLLFNHQKDNVKKLKNSKDVNENIHR